MMKSTKHNHHDPFRVQASACSLPHRYSEILQGFRAFRGFRGVVFLLAVIVALWISRAAAQTPEEQSAAVARTQKVAALLSSAQGPAADTAPRIAKANGGYLRHVGFPRGRGIEAIGADPQNPRDVAEKFLGQWRDAFVNPSEKVNFAVGRANTHRGRSYVRVQQKYGGLKIFDADLNIQVGADGRVQSVLCNVMRDTGVLDRGELSTSPTLTAEAAQETARHAVVQLFSDTTSTATLPASTITLQDLTASPPELLLFHPPVVGRNAPTRLVWSTAVHSDNPLLGERVFVDAHTGEVPLHFSLIKYDRHRKIYDREGSSDTSTPGTLVREEPPWGQAGDSGNDPVDRAYYFFGDIYDQNWNWHGLDSYDNAGHLIAASVKWGAENAGWTDDYQGSVPKHIFIGTYFLLDDISMHEYTHGVSDLYMELEYSGESAALSESFSDMWGEWFDQEHDYSNPNDPDDPDWFYGYTNKDTHPGGTNYDWLLAEDYEGTLPLEEVERNMKNPPGCSTWYGGPLPDRYKGPNWYTGDIDSGGAHHNCGVGDKVCYLLTDGDTFNGFTILPTGPSSPDTARREAAADLFYEAREALNAYSGYLALYLALIQSAENLDYTSSQILNLEKACQSVNIRNSSGGLTLKNGSDVKVALLEDSGQLLLKKALTTQAQSPIDTSGGGLIIRDTSGTVVAFINASTGESGGQMTILGSLTENNLPESSGKLFVVRYEGVPVITLDAGGNLNIWRAADPNNDAVEEPDYLEEQ